MNLLSKAEMKNVLGGVMSVQYLYNACLVSHGVVNDGTPEDYILWMMCDTQAQNACSFGQASGAICDYENWGGSIE
ncbi:hypothetical protein FA048_05805 [Pedobacter polaris]|uniref:Uncharacterized protein n=1 Tax=Pedobacter polaris TaxID=2571273 RepID=A0A4U1CWK1_9SPHI|nr:hypothetical protein [Pedobacter polaris]TKC13126.1 hypothetical protein FA048_05805 [Pedobacter polaris]